METRDVALADIRVADLSDTVAGRFCGRLLADFGADVVLVEHPGGSTLHRATARVLDGAPPRPPRALPLFRHLNSGKRSVVLDPRDPDGERILATLLGEVDVAILPPDIDLSPLGSAHPRIILASIHDFAPDTPLAHWRGPEIVIQALSGMMHNNGACGREPLYGCGERSAYAAGLSGYIAVLVALFARRQTGRGQVVTIDRAETAAAMAFPYVMQYLYSGHNRSRAELNIPAGQVLCRDGWVCIWIYNFRWRQVCETLGLEALIDDPRFDDPASRRANWDALFALIQDVVKERRADELVDDLQRAQVIAAKAATLVDLQEDAHLAARGYWESDGGNRILGPPFRMSRTPRRVPSPATDLPEPIRAAAVGG